MSEPVPLENRFRPPRAERKGGPSWEPLPAAGTTEEPDSARPSFTAALEFVAHLLSHEVKNPLVAIKTFTQLLEHRFDDAEFRADFYNIVSSDVERINSLVEAASGFCQLGRPNPTAVDVSAMLDHILKDFELMLLRKHIHVLRRSREPLPLAKADREQVVYALRCLISKAVDVMPEGDDLRVASLGITSPNGQIERLRTIVRFADPQGVMAEFPTAEVDDTTDRSLPGSLEIALAKAMVARQAGSLRIDTPGEGDTVLTIDLPVI